MTARPGTVPRGRDIAAQAAELERHADQVATKLALMANGKRLLILCRLSEGEASVGELQRFVGLSQSALSQHLGKLRAGGLVTTRREAQTIHYSLADEEMQNMMAALYEVFCAPSVAGGR